MDRSKVITLVSQTYEYDAIGQKKPVESLSEVFCDIQSVSMSEFIAAGTIGIKPDYKITMNRYDYNGELELIIDGTRYGVYRTYTYRTDDIELYVEKKAGVQNG